VIGIGAPATAPVPRLSAPSAIAGLLVRKARNVRKIFLACPYGHDDPRVVAQRFDISNRVAAAIMRAGHAVFSQVSMSHP
ncbi:DUF1937 family protein, partial [Stenotrophomonas maltophilia]|uniref:DUF1937 family protein n=1 Tax=Stenotrophomonas maltophilia TaxID=40324 RepID=UPI001953870F